jgi:hypothetical protein
VVVGSIRTDSSVSTEPSMAGAVNGCYRRANSSWLTGDLIAADAKEGARTAGRDRGTVRGPALLCGWLASTRPSPPRSARLSIASILGILAAINAGIGIIAGVTARWLTAPKQTAAGTWVRWNRQWKISQEEKRTPPRGCGDRHGRAQRRSREFTAAARNGAQEAVGIGRGLLSMPPSLSGFFLARNGVVPW